MSAPQQHNELPPSPIIEARLVALRRARLMVSIGSGIAMVLIAFVLLATSIILLDFWLDISWAGRAILLACLSMTVCSIAAFKMVLPFIQRPDDDALALEMENAIPAFRSRLISAVQLARPDALQQGASRLLAQALVRETENMVAPFDFTQFVDRKPLFQYSAICLAALLAGGGAFFAGGQDARDLLSRLFLSSTPVPRKTRVMVLNGDKTIGRGDNVVIEAAGSGILPKTGTLVIKSFLRRNLEFTMASATNTHSHYVRSIENVQQSFSYEVRLNDGSSRTHHIEVKPRPAVQRIECSQTYPAYTGLGEARRSLGDLSLLAGSKLVLNAFCTKNIRQARIHLEGLDSDGPVKIDPQNPKHLTTDLFIPAKGLSGFSLHMVDTDNMESRDPVVYPIEIIPDKVPSIRITAPERKEELVTRQATLMIGFEALDDFKLAKLRLLYRSGDLEKAAVQSVELDLEEGQNQKVRRVFPWKINSITPPLSIGTRIEFWMEAEDNNNVTGPGIASSEHQMARVVSDDEKRADLLNRAGDFIGAIGDITADQERLNKDLGTIIMEKKWNR